MSTTTMSMPRKLWEHPYPLQTNMAKFMRGTNEKRNMKLSTFEELYQWSIGDSREEFWQDCWDYFRIIHEGQYKQIIEAGVRMDNVPRWFQGVKLNFAENILYNSSPESTSQTCMAGKEDSKIAVTEVREGCTEIRQVTWAELRSKVGRLTSAMRERGMKKGDRAAVVSSNSLDTLSVFLAVTSLGGLFSSSSTDMGSKGVLDRLLQIKPKVLFVDDAGLYNGKKLDLRSKMTEIVKGMENTSEFEGVVSMPRWEKPLDVTSVPRCQTLEQYLTKATTDVPKFERVDFNDPFIVVYSSGTTGQPKCIVHSVGRVLLSASKEGILHRDQGPDTVQLQYTTTGWMYLTSVLSLLHGGRPILYDGSPFQPDAKAFVRLIGDEKVTNLGISPKWMQTLAAASISPREITDLSALRAVTTTGMVCPDSLFEWFYDVGFPPRAQLANISGGTDLAGCFGMENPLTPVYVGGCQGPSLGTPIAVYDSTITGGPGVSGKAISDGEQGELVAYKAFPNMPVMFWPGDKAAMKKYWEAYFEHFDNVWTHGDFVQIHPRTKQIFFLGRADGVLNPSGVRFGSAEIYNVIEKAFVGRIADSIVVGQRRPHDTDESVMLFLKMESGTSFTPSLVAEVKQAISVECSKRHVPRYIFETPEIPTTVNLKKVELPVKHIVSGRKVTASGTLLNPQSLDYYYQFAKDDVLAKSSRQNKL